MRSSVLLAVLPWLIAMCLSQAAEPDAQIPPIQSIDGARPNTGIFKVTKRGEPLVLRTVEEAGEYFGEKALASLNKSVDFKQQDVLVFAWRGSGQDKLTFDVAESFPEQVQFSLQPGRTRDLRQHVKVFALRANVKWTVGS